jgi:hypothetical protein
MMMNETALWLKVTMQGNMHVIIACIEIIGQPKVAVLSFSCALFSIPLVQNMLRWLPLEYLNYCMAP